MIEVANVADLLCRDRERERKGDRQMIERKTTEKDVRTLKVRPRRVLTRSTRISASPHRCWKSRPEWDRQVIKVEVWRVA